VVLLLATAGRLSPALAASGEAAEVLAAEVAAVLGGLRGARKALRVLVALLPLLLLLLVLEGGFGAAGRGSLNGLLLGRASS
jgi:hypothetical protein